MVNGQSPELPPYSVQESLRAKNVYLKISPAGDLRVVVPQGFSHQRIPEIVQRKRRWIERVTQNLRLHDGRRGSATDRPTQIELGAIAETWAIEYHPTQESQIRLTEHQTSQQRRLVLSGKTENQETCQILLKQWLTQQGYRHLVPWLQTISQDLHMPFWKATVRGQKTRWGSCSCKKAISLNYKLLFLPPPLVRYVLVHELCHTIHLNHSRSFWDLVQEQEPEYQQLDRDLRHARQYLPLWLETH